MDFLFKNNLKLVMQPLIDPARSKGVPIDIFVYDKRECFLWLRPIPWQSSQLEIGTDVEISYSNVYNILTIFLIYFKVLQNR